MRVQHGIIQEGELHMPLGKRLPLGIEKTKLYEIDDWSTVLHSASADATIFASLLELGKNLTEMFPSRAQLIHRSD